MKKLLLIAATWAIFIGVDAQSTSPQVIGNAGMHSTIANAQVSWTVGELVTETLFSASNMATQGFHQTMLTVVAIDAAVPDFQVDVFPNPASTELNIRFVKATTATLQLVDMHGNVVMEANQNDAAFRSLNVMKVSQGAYILRIAGDIPAHLQRFKIQIIHTH